jgi:hypothetical protein
MQSFWSNEDDFQGFLLKNYRRNFLRNIYPKVTKIAGVNLTPDIDVLGIDFNNKWIAGYEFKVLNKKTKDANYSQIYSGIGQALLCLNYGVDYAYLVLGIPKTSNIDVYFQKIKSVCNLIEFIAKSTNHFDRFKIWTFDEKNSLRGDFEMKTQIPIDELSRNNILSMKFTWTKGKHFLTKYSISQIN